MTRYLMNFVAAILLIGSMACTDNNSTVVRERANIDKDWMFVLDDVEGAQAVNYDDSKWRKLNVPHDWSIEGNYAENNPAGRAGAYLPTGIGWYRKVLDITPEDGKNYSIEFDGIYMNSDVWINGVHLGKRPYGYVGFSYDLTQHLTKGKNIIAVRVDHSKAPSGRWYTGSGIYRHVWLTTTSDIHIPQWGTFVRTPKVSTDEAKVVLTTKVVNKSSKATQISIKSNIRDKEGNIVATSTSQVSVNDTTSTTQKFIVVEPKLWSPETPYMYSVCTEITNGSELMDKYTTPLGIRTVELRGANGFYLNDKMIKLKGLSNHHDAGPVGAAVPEDVLYRRLKLMKEMGCNALRTTHNPFAPEFYAMCDTMGFLVMNEAFDGWFDAKAEFDYGLYFEKWWRKDLTDFMHRDRNHPCVIMWSIGNEVPKFTAEEQKLIVDYTKTIDTSRPISQGRGYLAPYIDLSGFNGHGEMKGAIEKHHKQFPERAIVGTEITHTLQTRGEYRTKSWYRTKDAPAPWEANADYRKVLRTATLIPDLTEEELFTGRSPHYQSSYDNAIVRIGVRDEWKRVEAYQYYIGNFRWTGFDYLGESFNWPKRTENFGIIDLAGFPKDHYYLYQSLWSDEPMVHLLPHWTHPGLEGKKIPVVVYTNTGAAELFLNGKSLGKKTMGEDLQLLWYVPYQEGTISAVAYANDGKRVEKSYTTAGKANKVKISVDKTAVKANSSDVIHCEIDITDAKGVMVPHANLMVNFEVSGPAKIIGVENGDILDLDPHKVNYRRTFNGKCLLMIQTTDASGEIKVKAMSDGLKQGEVTITSSVK